MSIICASCAFLIYETYWVGVMCTCICHVIFEISWQTKPWIAFMCTASQRPSAPAPQLSINALWAMAKPCGKLGGVSIWFFHKLLCALSKLGQFTDSGTKSFIIPRCGKFASHWSVHLVRLLVQNRELGMFKIIDFGRRLVLSRHISQGAGYHVISKGTGEQTNSVRRFPFWR